MGGVSYYGHGLLYTPVGVYVCYPGEWNTDDFLCSSHNPLKGLVVSVSAAPIPDSDTVCQNALSGPLIKRCHSRGGGSSLFFSLSTAVSGFSL